MRRFRLSRLAPAALAVAVASSLAACSVGAGDFSSNAEGYIDKDKDGDLMETLGVDFDGTVCAEPADTNEGTTFTCTSTGDDGNEWQFTAQISGKRDYEIVNAALVDGSSTTPGSTPPASTPPASETPTASTPATTVGQADPTAVTSTTA